MTLRVLVAEPSRTLAALIRATLLELGCDIETVADGSSAMAAARAQLPDALIVDVGLPGLDGYALAHAVRAAAGGRRVPTLLLAPDHAALDGERLAYVGIDEVLTKPFERAVLLERFEAMTGASRRRAAPARAYRDEPADAPVTDPAPSARRAAAPDPAATAAALEDIVESELQRRLPSLVDATLDRLLPVIVRERLAALVEERLADTFDRTVRAAVMDLAEPARIDALVREVAERQVAASTDAAVAGAKAAVSERAAADVAAFVREELQKKLERQAEQIIWKVVPALAEDLVKEEIKRLTEP